MSSLVLVRAVAGERRRWTKLDHVRLLIGDKDAFREYAAGKTRAFQAGTR